MVAPLPGPADAPSGATVQVPMGGSDEEPPHLAFTITKVYQDRSAIDTPPGHAAGGDWLFFDADAGGAPFTFGIRSPPAKGDPPMSFGEGVLVTTDRPRFVAALAKGFAQPLPDVSAGRGVPLKFGLVVLGRKLARSPGGGFVDGGTWTATKLFLQDGEVEVFFNFDPVAKRGEFSQKDADYDGDLITIAAQSL